MANHVSTYINFQNITDSGKDHLNRISADWDWKGDDLGPKWCYIEDASDDYIMLVSAWSYPRDGIEKLIETLAETDPNIKANITYQDEMPNFFGCAIMTAEGIVDEIEWQWEELIEHLHREVDGLKEHWDEEEEDWDEEGREIMNDHLWECISDLQSDWFVE